MTGSGTGGGRWPQGTSSPAASEETAQVRPEAPLEARAGRPACLASVCLAGGSLGGPRGPGEALGRQQDAGGGVGVGTPAHVHVGGRGPGRGRAPRPRPARRFVACADPHLCHRWAAGQGVIYTTANPRVPPGGERPFLDSPLMTGLGYGLRGGTGVDSGRLYPPSTEPRAGCERAGPGARGHVSPQRKGLGAPGRSWDFRGKWDGQ